jgi:hypothetical protein
LLCALTGCIGLLPRWWEYRIHPSCRPRRCVA